MSVFISYRREGGIDVARKIYDELQSDYKVFFDKESLRNGPYLSAIDNAIKDCDDFLLIIDSTTFDHCSEPGDWIVHEASTAINENKNIIPVLLDGRTYKNKAPESIKELFENNGVDWTDIRAVERLKEMLISSRHYVLTYEYLDGNFVLSEKSKEDLKDINCRFINLNRRVKTSIEIKPKDVETYTDQLMLTPEKARTEVEMLSCFRCCEGYKKQERYVKEALGYAVEFMLMDSLLDKYASDFCSEYIDKYGEEKCKIKCDDGVDHYLWTAFLWADMIEELLKEFYPSNKRANDYQQLGYLRIEGFRSENDWYFSSWIEEMPDMTRFMYLFDYYDIPERSLVSYIFPDFFFKLGEFKIRNKKGFEKYTSNSKVFNLMNYTFGPK